MGLSMTVSTVRRGEGPRRHIMRMEHLEPRKKTALEDRSPSSCTVPHPEFSTITTICDNRIVITCGLSVIQRVHCNPPKPKLLTTLESRGLSQQPSSGLRNRDYRTKILRMTDLGDFSYLQCSARRLGCQGRVSQNRRENDAR